MKSGEDRFLASAVMNRSVEDINCQASGATGQRLLFEADRDSGAGFGEMTGDLGRLPTQE